MIKLKSVSNNFLPIFYEENSIDKKDHIIATYYIITHPDKGDILNASYELAIGQSIGNP